MYIVSGDTTPNATRNLAFELAYWRFGLEHAGVWIERVDRASRRGAGGVGGRSFWDNLVPLPIEDGLHAVYVRIPSDFWDTPSYANDHSALVGLYEWLP